MSEEKKFLDLSDDELDAVAGGGSLYDTTWAKEKYQVGDEIDFTSYRPAGCRWCDATTLVGTITGVSGYAHSLCVKSKCCGMTYCLDVDNRTVQ